MCSTDLAYGAMLGVEQPDQGQVRYPICLRECYAMSGTDKAYDAIGLRTCYAMSGTDLAYGAASLLTLQSMNCKSDCGTGLLGTPLCATPCPVLTRYVLCRTCYAMSGTLLCAMPCPVLSRYVLCEDQY
eukprot:6849-Rhodomonas_salina.7